MSIGAICNRQIPITTKTASVAAAVKLMQVFGEQALLVTEEKHGKLFAVGILTETDIVSGVVAKDADPSTLVVADIMSSRLDTIRESASVYDTIRLMYKKDLKQVAVLDEAGGLVGIVTADRLFRSMAEEFIDFSTLILGKPSPPQKATSH